MKKLILILNFVAFSTILNAQLQTPAPSPEGKIYQKVGLTDVTVEYSRPSMNGRAIFGNLVPYDAMWRTGANKNTMITFSDDVKIGGKDVKAGSYAIFTKPGKEKWEVYFYADTNNWGVPRNWDESKVVASVTADAYPIPFDVQTFTIDIDNLTNNGAEIGMIWEKTYVGVPFQVPTDKKATASIERAMAGPSGQDYFSAAVYYLQEGKDLNKAKEWIDKAIAMSVTPENPDKPFWMLRQKSLIHAKLGDKAGAIATAKESLTLSKKAGNADYVKLNEDSLKEWGSK